MIEHLDSRTDRDLVLAARAGETSAFDELVDRHRQRAQRVALGMVGNHDIAQELAQEALLQAHLSLNALRDPARFGSWLHGIVRNVCRSYLRAQKVHYLALDDVAPTAARWYADERQEPSAQVEARELYDRVEQAVVGLSSKNQIAVRLFYYEQLSVREIAAHLNISVNAVKGRLFQARAQLREQLAAVVASYRWDTAVDHTVHTERKSNMLEISSVHVVKTPRYHRTLYLLDTTKYRVLTIWIGAHEAELIDMRLRGSQPERPMTYQFIVSLLKSLGAELEKVCVSEVRDTTFFATVTVRQGESVREIDARPSDAIAAAVHMDCPIYVAEEVMEKAGQDLPQPFEEAAWLQRVTEKTAELYRAMDALMQAFDREPGSFTVHAYGVLQRLTAAARTLNHNYIGTEHLLWCLAGAQDETAQLLRELGANADAVEESLLRLVERGEQPPINDPVVAPRVAQVLQLAQEAQTERAALQLGTEHLLLGILREGNGMAVAILRDLGLDVAEVRAQLLARMGAA